MLISFGLIPFSYVKPAFLPTREIKQGDALHKDPHVLLGFLFRFLRTRRRETGSWWGMKTDYQECPNTVLLFYGCRWFSDFSLNWTISGRWRARAPWLLDSFMDQIKRSFLLPPMTFRKAVCSECVLLNLHFSPEWLIFSKGIPGSEPEKTLPSTCKNLSVAMDNSESCSIEFFWFQPC